MSEKPPPPPRSIPEKAPRLNEEAILDALIGKKLRSYFDELMAEPVPNRILDLLAQLEAKESDESSEPAHKTPEQG